VQIAKNVLSARLLAAKPTARTASTKASAKRTARRSNIL
jgi:hypothetical protein